jgi:hypothetical protein
MAELTFDDYVISVEGITYSASFEARDFTKVVYLVPFATNSLAGANGTALGANDSIYVTLNGAGDANKANLATAGSFSATTINALTAFFQQRTRPAKITVISVDLVGGDTYAGIIATYIAAGEDFFWLGSQLRTAANIVALSGALAALDKKCVFVGQCNDSTIIGNGATYAAGTLGTAWTTKEYCFGLLAPDAVFDDMRYLGQISTFKYTIDKCPPSDLVFIGATAKTYTKSQRDNALANNWNVNATIGKKNITNPGTTADGAPLYHTISAESFNDMLLVRLGELKVSNSVGKKKLPMNIVGQRLVKAEVLTIVDFFFDREHFDKTREYIVEPVVLTPELIAAETIPVYVEVYFLNSARRLFVKYFARE